MITLFVGAGYTGARVLERLPDAIALGRSRHGDEQLDLDGDDPLQVDLPEQYAVIYSVPPAEDQPGDPRLARFLALLPHPPARIVYLSTTASTVIATVIAWTRKANHARSPLARSAGSPPSRCWRSGARGGIRRWLSCASRAFMAPGGWAPTESRRQCR